AADPVPRAAPRRAVRALLAARARARPRLDRARPRGRRSLADRRRLARHLARLDRRRRIARRCRLVRALPRPGRARARQARPAVAPLLWVPVRRRLPRLRRARLVVPVRAHRRPGLAARPPSVRPGTGLAAARE